MLTRLYGASARKVIGVGIAAVLVVGTAALGHVNAWTTDDPTRVVVYEGKSGVDDGVLTTSSQNVDVDNSGNLYALLSTGGELSVGPGPNSATVGSLASGAYVLTKTDTSGNLVWVREWSTTGIFPLHLIVTTDAVFVTATVHGSLDLDPTTGSDPYISASNAEDSVVLQLDLDGNYVGHLAIPALANKRVRINALAEAADGNVIVSGDLNGDTTFPQGSNPTPYSITSVTSQEGFLAKLNRTTGGTDWLITLTGSGNESIPQISVDLNGSITALGSFTASSAVLDSSAGGGRSVTRGPVSEATVVFSLTTAGAITYVQERGVGGRHIISIGDGAVLVQFTSGELHRFDSAGQSVLVGQFLRQIDSSVRTTDGKLRLAGYFNGALDFDIGSGIDTRTPTQNNEGFLLTVTSDFRTESVQIFTGPTSAYASSLATMPDGGFALSGMSTAGTINFSNTASAASYTSSPAMTHMFFIVRYDAAGTTGTTTTTTTTTLPAVAAPPSVRYTTGNKKVTVRWTAVDGAASYVVSTTKGTAVCTSTTTSCTISKLKNGKLYTYVVQSVNSAGVVSSDSRSVRVIPGFTLKTTTFKVKKKPTLSSILTTPSKGSKRWSVVSGSCRRSGSRLVMPTKAGSCKLRLTVAKRGAYPAMTTTVKIVVTR